MSRDTWEPAQYERFKSERAQPFHDLLALVRPVRGGRTVDLGCGTGELTSLLHHHAQASVTVGVDRSESMLESSAPFASEFVRFRRGDIAEFTEGGWDIIVSNAALHWLPDHRGLFSRLTGLLAPRGQLAVQMPANFDHPSHLVAREVSREEPFQTALAGWEREPPVLSPVEYAQLLDELGFVEQHVRLQVYGHHLGSKADVVEWVKGTLLTDYRERLSADCYGRFLERYRERLMLVLPDTRPFFYPFKRLLLWGRR